MNPFFLINILHDNEGKQNEHHVWEHGVIMNKETTLFVFIKSKGQDKHILIWMRQFD
jgi:hypothetical protein